MTESLQDTRPIRGITAVRLGLGLGEAEHVLLRSEAHKLMPHVPAWVDAFYTRLLIDPIAMRILEDDASVVRLKRSLHSWFHEMLTLPWDATYERARARVGEAHVRIHMPTDLMVTAMSGLRCDANATIRRLYPDHSDHAHHLADVFSRALDMELTLMLLAFRRHERALSRRKDRMVYAERAARRLAHTLHDRVDAALCYATLADTEDDRRREWLGRLQDILRGLARVDQRVRVHAKVHGVAPADLCRLALADVSADADTTIAYRVEPPDLAVHLNARAAQLAIEELAQNGAEHAAGGTIDITCRPTPEGGVSIEVTDDGPGWGRTIQDFSDIYREGSGLGLSFCELVAELHDGHIELFTTAQGGAGVRLQLAPRPRDRVEQGA
ncbi:MAG: protoglobin domain-containing protein [Planctomycetota bacterium]|nr:protoglobin domain-containing protein [Planctomycetota bacterium]